MVLFVHDIDPDLPYSPELGVFLIGFFFPSVLVVVGVVILRYSNSIDSSNSFELFTFCEFPESGEGSQFLFSFGSVCCVILTSSGGWALNSIADVFGQRKEEVCVLSYFYHAVLVWMYLCAN